MDLVVQLLQIVGPILIQFFIVGKILNTALENQARNRSPLLRGLAYLVRGDSYKYHDKGYYCSRAADDYAVLLTTAPHTFRALIGKGFSVKHLENIDKMLMTLNLFGEFDIPKVLASFPDRVKNSPVYSALLPYRPRNSGMNKLHTCTKPSSILRRQMRDSLLLDENLCGDFETELEQKLYATG